MGHPAYGNQRSCFQLDGAKWISNWIVSTGFQNDSLLLTHMLNFSKTLHNGKNILVNIKLN